VNLGGGGEAPGLLSQRQQRQPPSACCVACAGSGALVYVLLARVEEVEREVVALVDGAELVLLPVLISHDHAVGVARALVPDLQRDVEGLADVIRTVLRGQLLEQQQLGATLLVGQCQRQCTTQRHAEQATHLQRAAQRESDRSGAGRRLLGLGNGCEVGCLLSSAQQAVELSAQQCHTQAA